MSRNLIIISGTSLVLSAVTFQALRKMIPVSISSLVSHCQNLSQSLSIHFPHLVWPLIAIFTGVTLAVTSLKLLVSFVKIQRLTLALCKNLIVQERFTRSVEKVGLSGQAKLVESDRAFAFCLGIFKPTIYLSAKMVRITTGKELEIILRHEKYHLDNRDTLTVLLTHISKSLFPFFPVIGDFARNFRIEKEIKADQEAIRDGGSKRSLVTILSKLLSEPPYKLAFSLQIADLDSLEFRIRALKSNDFDFKHFQPLGVFVSFIFAVLLIGIVIAPVQALELHDENKDIVLVCVSKPYTQAISVQTPATPVDMSTQ